MENKLSLIDINKRWKMSIMSDFAMNFLKEKIRRTGRRVIISKCFCGLPATETDFSNTICAGHGEALADALNAHDDGMGISDKKMAFLVKAIFNE